MNDDIKKIIEAAIKAPSGENCQPWRFRVAGNSIELHNDPASDMSLYNDNQRGTFVAHGAALENIEIASRHFGYAPHVDIFPNGQNDNLVARITLKQSSPTQEPLFDSISRRVTNRKAYEIQPLKLETRNQILGSVTDDDLHIELAENRDQINTLATISSNHERLLFENKFLHDFFFDHIRWDDEQNKTNPSGFFIKTLELAPPEEKAFGLIKHWFFARLLGLVGMPKKAAEANAKKYEASAAIGVIYASNNNPQTLIAAGRTFQRLWLVATKEGLSLQPLTGLLFLRQHILSNTHSPLTLSEQQVIKDSYQGIAKVYGINTNSEQILLMFRIGKGDPPTAQASRYDLERFMIS